MTAAADTTPATEADEQVSLRAYRFTLDPRDSQLPALAGHAGAARFAFNHALAAKVTAHQEWRDMVDKLVADGMDEVEAKKQVKVPFPNKAAIQKTFNQIKGDDRTDEPGIAPWWHHYSTYAFQSAFIDADQAWSNWLKSLQGKRAGRRVGYPRFKKKGRCRDSFRIHHTVTHPTIRLDGYRRLIIPRLGSIRLHDSGKRLGRHLKRGAVVQSVTVARGGHRWYASVLVKAPLDEPDPTRRQRTAGRIGVAIGIPHLATLSTGELVENPRHLNHDINRLARAQRAHSRTAKGSQRRHRAIRRISRIHGIIAERRAGTLNQLTKRLATGWAEVALPDFDVVAMTQSAPRRKRRGNLKHPPQVTALLNRSILDVAPGELKRQLAYKTRWYGSRLALCDKGAAVSVTCSNCGTAKTKLTPSMLVFRCDHCGFTTRRTLNTALNVARVAVCVDESGSDDTSVASDRGDTQNARREPVRPTTPRGGRRGSLKREDPG